MTVTSACYCTREMVKGALDVKDSARADDRVDRAIQAATDNVDGCMRRRFIPWTGTKYFTWPDAAYRTPWRLWLDQTEAISVSQLTTNNGTVTVPSTNWFLEPANTGPPFASIEISLASSSAFASGTTFQRAIAVTGVFGYRADEEQVGTVATNLAASASATANVTWSSSGVGVGDLLRIDSERVLVTDRTMSDSGVTLTGVLTNTANATSIAVPSGQAFAVGETLLVDSERMLVVDVAGNTLTVKRAYDGTPLASHAIGAKVYTLTGVTLARAQEGTTLAAHSTGAAIYRHINPALIRDLAVAYATTQLLQESSGYIQVAPFSESNRQHPPGRGLAQIQADAMSRYARQLRLRSV